MKHAIAACIAVVVVAGCKKEPIRDRSAKLPPARASALGEFKDNPLLAHVPLDTPYAVATFKPIPVDYYKEMAGYLRPAFSEALAAEGADGDKLRALVDEIGTFSVKRFEELGFAVDGRIVVYGIGAAPLVARMEIRDGDKLFAFVDRVATRWGERLPEPAVEDGRRIWQFDSHASTTMLVIGKTELVLAIGSRDQITARRAMIIGTEKPTKSLPTAHFKQIAERHGYNAQSVGFVDLVRLVPAIGSALGDKAPPAACMAAIQRVAQRVPRVTIGYDDLLLTTQAGMVIELAPDLLAEAKKLKTRLPGIGRLLAQQPMFGVAVAADLGHVRTLGARAAGSLREIGSVCGVDEIAAAADNLETTARAGLPPFLEGATGGVAGVTRFELAPGGPPMIDGWGIVKLADTNGLIALANQEMPNLQLKADGQPRALPAEVEVPGHIIVTRDSVGVAVGADSKRIARETLGVGTDAAPLALLMMDYPRFFAAMAKVKPDEAHMADVAKLIGMLTLQWDVDDRGMVLWMTSKSQ